MGGRGSLSRSILSTVSNAKVVGGGGGVMQSKPAGGGGDVDFLQDKIAGPGGSNAGGVFRGSDGKERYVKFYKDPTQGKGEVLANSIYNDLGIDAPRSFTFKTKEGKEAVASEMVSDVKQMGMNPTKVTASQIMRGIVADTLMANRDPIGLVGDNILLTGNGRILRVDNGGSFLHRAQGARKNDSELDGISELDFFITKSSQYKWVAERAGIYSVRDLGKDLNRQVNSVSTLRRKYNGWDNYVKKKMPDWKGPERDRVVRMLEARTNALEKLLKNT